MYTIPYFLTLNSILIIYLAGEKNTLGRMLGIVAQPIRLIWGVYSEQYYLCLSAFIYMYVYINNYKKRKTQ